MKKLSLLLAAVAGMSYLSADAAGTTPNAANTNTMSDDAFLKQPMQPVTPAITPDTVDAILSADFIWWKTTIDNLQFTASGIATASTNGQPVGSGSFNNANFNYQPGFKVALGFTTGHDGWDLIAEYTWLNPGEKTKSSTLGSNGLMGSFPTVFSNGSAGNFALRSATAELKHHFNVVDLMLGRNFFISKFLSLKPQVGWKFAWLKDKYQVNYTTYSGPYASSTEFEQSTFATGIRAGLGTLWHFDRHFGLYGDIFFSGLWDWTTTSEDQTTNNVVTVNNSATFQTMIPVLEFGLGFDYTTWFCQDTCQFSMRAGWEQQAWINYSTIDNGYFLTKGNMNMQGLTIKLGLMW